MNLNTDLKMNNINEISQELVQCSICLRRMRQDVYVKHPKLCRENPLNKRQINIFDMTQYRSIKIGDKIIPVCQISPININQSNNTYVRPSETRSIKRERRSDSVIPPIINNFCMLHIFNYIHII